MTYLYQTILNITEENKILFRIILYHFETVTIQKVSYKVPNEE